jgi:hypothetical protein
VAWATTSAVTRAAHIAPQHHHGGVEIAGEVQQTRGDILDRDHLLADVVDAMNMPAGSFDCRLRSFGATHVSTRWQRTRAERHRLVSIGDGEDQRLFQHSGKRRAELDGADAVGAAVARDDRALDHSFTPPRPSRCRRL